MSAEKKREAWAMTLWTRLRNWWTPPDSGERLVGRITGHDDDTIPVRLSGPQVGCGHCGWWHEGKDDAEVLAAFRAHHLDKHTREGQ